MCKEIFFMHWYWIGTRHQQKSTSLGIEIDIGMEKNCIEHLQTGWELRVTINPRFNPNNLKNKMSAGSMLSSCLSHSTSADQTHFNQTRVGDCWKHCKTTQNGFRACYWCFCLARLCDWRTLFIGLTCSSKMFCCHAQSVCSRGMLPQCPNSWRCLIRQKKKKGLTELHPPRSQQEGVGSARSIFSSRSASQNGSSAFFLHPPQKATQSH